MNERIALVFKNVKSAIRLFSCSRSLSKERKSKFPTLLNAVRGSARSKLTPCSQAENCLRQRHLKKTHLIPMIQILYLLNVSDFLGGEDD